MNKKIRNKKIEYWDDERSLGNSLIVTLVAGWRFDDFGEHVRGFDTQREALIDVRAAKRCDCSQCREIFQSVK
jgi:hypothetical protein